MGLVKLFACVDALYSSPKFFRHIGTFSCRPGLNEY